MPCRSYTILLSPVALPGLCFSISIYASVSPIKIEIEIESASFQPDQLARAPLAVANHVLVLSYGLSIITCLYVH